MINTARKKNTYPVKRERWGGCVIKGDRKWTKEVRRGEGRDRSMRRGLGGERSEGGRGAKEVEKEEKTGANRRIISKAITEQGKVEKKNQETDKRDKRSKRGGNRRREMLCF